jgi:hypothetical protein
VPPPSGPHCALCVCLSVGPSRSRCFGTVPSQTGAVATPLGGTEAQTVKYRERALTHPQLSPASPPTAASRLVARGTRRVRQTGKGWRGDLSGSATPGSRLDPPPPAPAPSFALWGGASGGRCRAGQVGARPARRRPGSRALPAGARLPPRGAAPGGRAARTATGELRCGGGERGGGLPAPPAPPAAPSGRAAINGAGGGGGSWRRRGGAGGRLCCDLRIGGRGGRRSLSEVQERGPGQLRFARLGPLRRAPSPAPAAEPLLFTFDRVFPAPGRCPGRLRAGDCARHSRAALCALPAPGKGASGCPAVTAR